MILYVDIRKGPEQETPSPKLGLNQKEGLNIPRIILIQSVRNYIKEKLD